MAEHRRTKNTSGVPVQRRNAAIAGLAGVLAITGLGGAKVLSAGSDAGSNCRHTSVVQVAVPSSIGDAVRHAATAVQERGDVCATYSINEENPGDTYQSIIASSSDEPQVWISDSPAWGQLIQKKLGDGWVTIGDTIATSPVVMGVPASLKSAAASHKNWLDLLDNKLPVSFVDTNAATESLMAVIAANQQAATTTERSSLMKDVLRLSRSLTTSETMRQNALEGADHARIFPISEQQLLSFNVQHTDKPLTAMVPTGGVSELQYQWLTPVRGTPADTAALTALKAELMTPAQQQYRQAQGFRMPGQKRLPVQGALAASTPVMPTPSAAVVAGADTAWNNLKKDARMLVLIDVSGSMMTPVVGTDQTRVELMENTAIAALNVLPQTTRLGAWAFSSDLQAGHVDYLPLSDGEQTINDPTYKDRLIAEAKTLPSLAAKNGDTALYDSIAAAYKSVSDTYDPTYINSVVVLTDGTNDDPNGGLSLPQLLAKLKAQYKVDKPVKIVTISLGTGTDPSALQQIAKSTDGLSYMTQTPSQIGQVFVDAFLRRSD